MVDTQNNSLTKLIKKIEILNTSLETGRKRDNIAVLNIVEDKFFTPHDFISLATRITSILIGEQKISLTLVRPKASSRANRAVWTKNHPRRNNVHGQ